MLFLTLFKVTNREKKGLVYKHYMNPFFPSWKSLGVGPHPFPAISDQGISTAEGQRWGPNTTVSRGAQLELMCACVFCVCLCVSSPKSSGALRRLWRGFCEAEREKWASWRLTSSYSKQLQSEVNREEVTATLISTCKRLKTTLPLFLVIFDLTVTSSFFPQAYLPRLS